MSRRASSPSSPLFSSTLIVAMLVGAAGCSKGGPAPKRERPPPLVAVAKVTARDVPVEVRAPVDLRPLAQADVGSKTLGYLDAVLVDRGDRVKRGQVLALVRPSDLPDQLAVARGQLAQTQAQLALAKTNYDRASQLAPSGVVSQQELQSATAALRQAEAAEAAVRAQMNALGTRIGEMRIESPLDGWVTTRRLDPGALVGPPGGGAIVSVARIDTLRVFVAVPEREAAGLEVGKQAHVELDALPGKTFQGAVVRLAPAFDPGTRTLDAEVQLPNPSGELRPGMYGRGAIVLATHPHAIVVPVEAVQVSNDKRFAFVLAGETVQRRPIEIGVDGGDWLEVTRGLAEGDEVVVAGADGLSDGAKVRVARPGVPAASGAAAASAAAPAASAAAPAASDVPAAVKTH